MAKPIGAAALHQNAIVIDMVCPLLAKEEYLAEWIKGGATCVGPTVASDNTLTETMAAIATWYDRFQRFGDTILHVTRVEDIARAKQLFALIESLTGAPGTMPDGVIPPPAAAA